jgi:hypothetical protein
MNSWQLSLLLGNGFAFGHGRTAKIDLFLSPFLGSIISLLILLWFSNVFFSAVSSSLRAQVQSLLVPFGIHMGCCQLYWLTTCCLPINAQRASPGTPHHSAWLVHLILSLRWFVFVFLKKLNFFIYFKLIFFDVFKLF